MIPKRPTVVDVARAAGVSRSTVSLVMQGSNLVKPETRERVQKAIRDVGYIYNRSAARLRSTKAGLIGLVINDLRNPFFAEFAISVQMEFSRHGYATVLANTDENPDTQAQVIESMIEHGVSALVISPTFGRGSSTFNRIADIGVPTMQVLRKVDDRVHRFPAVLFANTQGGRDATRHLIECGCRNIAFIGGFEQFTTTHERVQGYREVMTAADREMLIIHGRASREFGRETAWRLIGDYPAFDGIFCFNDLVALGVNAALLEAGRRAGRDYRLIGFDDIEECAQTWPKLSSICCGVNAFGCRTAQTMLDWFKTGKLPAPETRSDVRLVARESTTGRYV